MFQKNNKYNLDGIKRIKIMCSLFKIEVVNSESNQLELFWTDTFKRKLNISTEDNTLIIKDKAEIAIYATPLDLIELKRDGQFIIKIPQNYKGSVTVQSKEEKIIVHDLTFNGKLGISSNTGHIQLDNVNAEVINIVGNHGKINCCNISCLDMIDISSTDGKIDCYIYDKEENYTILTQSKPRKSNIPQQSGNGYKKLRVCSKLGRITVKFHDKISWPTNHKKYNSKDSFENW